MDTWWGGDSEKYESLKLPLFLKSTWSAFVAPEHSLYEPLCSRDEIWPLIAAEHQHNSHSVVEPFVFTGVGPRQHKGRENGKRISELKLSD